MVKLIFMNIKDFVRNKTGIFIFFILTLIIASFSGIFLMNEMTRSTFNESGIKGEYFLLFEEPVEYAEIQTALNDSFLFPSTELYIDHNALKYNDFPIQNNGGVIISVELLKTESL